MLNKMEKLITKKNLFILTIFIFILMCALFFVIQNSNKEDEKLFDIYLANLYNDEKINLDEKLNYLSSLDNSKVSFFSDLKLTSIKDIDRYSKIDKDILLLKKALINLDKELIESLSKDVNFTFNEIMEIYLYNLDINNYKPRENEKDNLNNFFIKAIDRLSNEKN
tara:strand:- start:5128 stop:5625 length:498 start_codon:yes stop_codon:yes gene_type:complete